MNQHVVLTEKLRRPEAAGLGRARLERPLLDGNSRLGLVVAPPGSGKTTLLARVAAASPTPVAWYRVTADDTDESVLVAHLARALRDALGVDVDDTAMGALLASLERWSGSGAMVILDDLHEIAGSAAEVGLEQFVTLRPHQLRVLVGSRRQPGMNIPRLRVSGTLLEISSDDLRFRSWEVEELFISVFREPLSPESAAALTRRTGGWAAGLQLFHLSTTGRSAADRQRAVADLGGRSKLVRSYLAHNVLAELPEDRRQFLLRTCTLGSLTGALCDALLETTGSAAILDEFEQQQLFTSSEDDGTTFRYHEVLRAHLEWALVQQYGAAGARLWYSRSAALLESIGDQRGAVRAYARAEDWGAVARLIQASGSGPDDAAAAADILLPAVVVQQDPWLSLAEARRRVREGSLTAAVRAFKQAENLLEEPEFRDSCRRERAVAEMWSVGRPADPGWLGEPRPDKRHWSVRLRQATIRAPGDQVRVAVGTANGDGHHRQSSVAGPGDMLSGGLAALLDGDAGTSRRLLEAVEADEHADRSQRLLAQFARTVIDLLTGGCDDPSGALGQVALDAELIGLPWLSRLARGVQEAVLVSLGSPAWRLAACADLLVECERTGDDWGAALLRLVVAIAGQIASEIPGQVPGQIPRDTADPADFADAALRFRRLAAPVLAVWAETLQTCFLARAGAPGALDFAATVAAAARSLQLPAAVELADSAMRAFTSADPGDDSKPGLAALGMLLPRSERTEIPAQTTRSGVTQAESGAATTNSAGGSAAQPRPGGGGGADDGSSKADPGPVLPPALPVQVSCFGGFRFQVAGEQIDLGSLRPRARALWRLLALTPDHDVHRERLVDALWPGVDLSVGTRRLQVAVSSVRQLLEQNGLPGADVLTRHGDAYRLALPTGSTVDIRSFEAALREAASCAVGGDTPGSARARAAALALYTGDLLPEDGPADYLVDDRERFRLAAASAAAGLARDALELGRPREALDAARLSVQLDRYQDLAWELLVDLHEAAGDSSAAARARHEHARVQAELDVV